MFPIRYFFILFAVLITVVQTTGAPPAPPAQSPSLDCTFRNESAIFAPQQSIILDVILRSQTPNVHTAELHAALTDLSQPEHPLITGYNIRIVPLTPLPISFVTPEKEGVYEITLSVVLPAEQGTRSSRPFQIVPQTPNQQTLKVSRQFVVLNPQTSPRSTGDWTLTDKRDLSAKEGDSPTRRQLLSFPRVPDLPRITDLPRMTNLPRPVQLLNVPSFGRRSSSNSQDHLFPPELLPIEPGELLLLPSSGEFLEKSGQNPGFSALPPAGTDGCAWHTFPIETESGQPYLIEIDYPVNVPQTLGAAVVKSIYKATGTAEIYDTSHVKQPYTEPYNVFKGEVIIAANIRVAEEIAQDTNTETAATHQLLFWATSHSTELVLVNRQPDREALFRNIRVSRVTTLRQEDQRLPKLFEGTAQRKRIGQVLTATPTPANWQESYEQCSRLIDKLHRGGYDGVTLTVLSKNSSFYSAGASDSLEMMFRQFDREELTLIPAIEFDMPIPSLEQLLLQHPGITEEILVGGSEHCRYNLLHPAVQQAMAEMVLELADRFGQHPSFGGIAIVLSPETYAQLPFALYPPDDYTFAQFRQEIETQLDVPFPDELHLRSTLPTQQFLTQKNARRLQFLNDPQVWDKWIRWRTAKVSGFYANLAQQISARRADVSLYLLGGTMLDHPDIQEYCRPTLPNNFAPVLALQLLGFDLSLISQAESLHFLKPVQISETRNDTYDSLDTADTVPLFSESGIVPGVQFVHTDTDYFVTTPAHVQSRKRFVRQLAQADVFMFMDSGVSLPFGQESATFDALDTYRRLPRVPFQTFQPLAENSTQKSTTLQPLTIRFNNSPDGLIVYIVNDAPFSVEADFVFSASANTSMTELTEHRMIRSLSRSPLRSGEHTWRASLSPYDLLAIRISDANAKIESVSVHCPPFLVDAEGVFKQKVDALTRRIHAARFGVHWDGLLNADFELPPDAAGGITGWEFTGSTLTAQLDNVVAYQGQNCVKLTNGSAEPGTFWSQPLDIPATGRLSVSMYVGVPADCKSLPMSVVLSAKHRGKPVYRNVPVEETLLPCFANVEPKNGVRWHRLLVPFGRLPLESLEEVRIGIQYSDSGTIWFDDITLYQVLFSANEMVELQRRLVVADKYCTDGRVSDLTSLLEGYWTQFLFRYVPDSVPQPVVSPPTPRVAQEVAEPPQSRSWYQRARGWVGLK